MGIIHENVGFLTIILSNQDIVSLSPDQLIWSFKMVYHLLKSNKYFLRYCQLSELRPHPVVSILKWYNKAHILPETWFVFGNQCRRNRHKQHEIFT